MRLKKTLLFALCLFILAVVSSAASDTDLDKRLEDLQKKMEDATKNGQPPPQDLMEEIQKVMEEMQKDQESDEEQEEDTSGGFVEVPFSGFITITQTIQGSAKMPQDEGGDASWSMSGHGSLRATITRCAEIKDDEGNIIGYQPVGHVTGSISERESFNGGAVTATSVYTASDRKDHQFDPNDIDGWCKLYVNPTEKTYEITFPSIYLGNGKGLTTITVTTKDFTQTTTEPYHGVETGVGWEGPIRKKLTYNPKSGVISGSDTFSTTEISRILRESDSGSSPYHSQAVAALQEVEAMRQEAKGKSPGYGEATYTVSWNLQIGKQKAKVVLEPADDYDKWMPQLPMGAGNMVKIKARIEEPAGLQGKFEFKLEDVSKEPGVCMNYPFENAKDDPDLKIMPSGSGIIVENEGQTARTDSDVNEAIVLVQVFDWAAYGKLSATAKLVIGGEEIEVQATAKGTGEPYVTIPKDDNSNSIADAWEKESGVYPCAGDADEDDTPEGKCKGDGLSAYEEYRGFFVQGFHKRLNPKKKDLFVYDPDTLVQQSNLASATQLEVHYPTDKESRCTGSANKVVNFNTDRYHIIDQHCLWVKKEMHGTADPFNWGACEGGAEIGPPRTADKYVLVFADQIREDIANVFRKNKPEITNQLGQKGIRPDSAWLDGQVQGAISMVTTHESCHGLGISHHYKSLRLTLPKGQDIEEAIMSGNISPSTGQMSCVMRYIWDGSKHPRITIHAEDELLAILCGRPWANTLCGPGGFDDCRGQIVVSDAEEGQTFE